MTRLWSIIFSMVSTTLMGVGVVIALTTGFDTLVPLLAAAGGGLVAAVPVSWLLARKIASL